MSEVIVNYTKPTRSGHRTGWARTFTDVEDDTRGVKAFTGGEYLREGENRLPVGMLVLYIEPVGSVKNGHNDASICEVSSDGDLYEVTGKQFVWHREFESLRNEAKDLLKARGSATAEPEETNMQDATEVMWGILQFFSPKDRQKILNGLARRS